MVGCLLPLLAALQPAGTPPRFERLDNGLRVAVVADHALPLVSVQLWYRVGSACDAPGRPGLCHLVRAILEQRDEAPRRLRAAGARCQSGTLRDACYFSAVLPPGSLARVLDIESERMQPLRLTPTMLAAALASAARDCGREPDDPDRLAERQLLAAMFPDHPYQHPPEFVAESLKDLQALDVQEFLDRWFVPGNATLLIIGDVGPLGALELVRQRLGKLPWRQPPRRAEIRPPAPATVRTSIAAPARSGLEIAWLTLPMGYFENAALDVLMQRLCNPVDGALCLRLRDLGCPPPGWRRQGWRHGGLLVLSVARAAPAGSAGRSAGASPTPADLEQIVREELAKAARVIPTEIEHNRARALALRAVRNARAVFDDRARRLAAYEMIAGDLLLAELELPRLHAVTVPDVQQAALALQTARTVVALRLAQTPDRPKDRPARTAAPPRPLKAAAPRPPATAAAPGPPATPIRHELANGVKVVFRRTPGRELAEVRTLLEGGSGLGQAAGALIAVGSRRHSVDEIRDYLSYHGLDLFPLMGSGGPGLRSRGPVARLAQMIELQAELLRQPRCDEAAGREGSRAIRAFLGSRSGGDPRGQAAAYLPPGLIAWVPAMAALADADLHQALRRLAGLRAVEVRLAADAEPRRAFDAVARAWADWSP